MKVFNRSRVPQAWGEVILQPGEVWEGGVIAVRDPLDHDGDGKKGGSLPKSRRGRAPKAK